MGWFQPSNLAEEQDPGWQRKRRLRMAGLGILGLALSTTVVLWLSSGQRERQQREAEARDLIEARQAESPPDETQTRIPDRSRDPRVIQMARDSIARADPWALEWVAAWERRAADSADALDCLRVVELLWMSGDQVHARYWHRQLRRALANPEADFDELPANHADRVKVVHALTQGRLESALGHLLQRAEERPLSDEELLMEMVVRRDMADGVLWAGWVERAIELADQPGRGGALARMQLLHLIETGTAAKLPERLISIIPAGSPAHPDASEAGDFEPTADEADDEQTQDRTAGHGVDAEPEVARALAMWLRDLWRTRFNDNPETEFAALSMDWRLGRSDAERGEIIGQMITLSLSLHPVQRVHAAEWMARHGAWEGVRRLLDRDLGSPVSPRVLDLYGTAMGQTEAGEEFVEELRRANTRWPEPLSFLWIARLSMADPDATTPPVVEGMLVRAARGARTYDPVWVFDVARMAFQSGFPSTGRSLLIMATEEPGTRERALSMLLDRAFEEASGEDALYIIRPLAELDDFPGPYYDLMRWLMLTTGDEPAEIMAKTDKRLERVDPTSEAEACFVAAAAAYEAGDHDKALTRLMRIVPNELPSRYFPFYFALADALDYTGTQDVQLEPRVGDPPVYITHEEARWLERLR